MITISEAAARAGVGEETVRRWVRAGRLDSRRDGPRLLVYREQVDELAAPAALELPHRWRETWLDSPPDWVAALRRSRRGIR